MKINSIIYKKYGHQDYIGARPDVLLASAAVIPIGGVYISEAVMSAGAAIELIAAGTTITAAAPLIIGGGLIVASGYGLYKLFLTSNDAQRYEDLHEEVEEINKLQSGSSDNIFEKRKAGDESKSRSKVKDSVRSTSASGMPDPNDDEPEEEKEEKEDKNKQEFDPSKEENHDQVKRDVKFGKLYRDSKDKKVWYSKERSGDRAHGGVHWKKFMKRGEELIHEADVDLTGKVMDKHKSTVGAVIRFKDLIGIK